MLERRGKIHALQFEEEDDFEFWWTVDMYKDRMTRKRCKRWCMFYNVRDVSRHNKHCCSHQFCYASGEKRCIIRRNLRPEFRKRTDRICFDIETLQRPKMTLKELDPDRDDWTYWTYKQPEDEEGKQRLPKRHKKSSAHSAKFLPKQHKKNKKSSAHSAKFQQRPERPPQPEEIKAAVIRAMFKRDILPSQIEGEPLLNDLTKVWNSQRYFEANCFAWYVCSCGKSWSRHDCKCYFDLKMHTICYRHTMKCMQCYNSPIQPVFSLDEIQEMADFVIESYVAYMKQKTSNVTSIVVKHQVVPAKQNMKLVKTDSERKKLAYQQQPGRRKIKEIIGTVSSECGIAPSMIPEERLDLSVVQNSNRYFRIAWYGCLQNHWWQSNNSQCYIDLKAQTICHRVSRKCLCNTFIHPKFTSEVIAKMAMDAAYQFLTMKQSKDLNLTVSTAIPAKKQALAAKKRTKEKCESSGSEKKSILGAYPGNTAGKNRTPVVKPGMSNLVSNTAGVRATVLESPPAIIQPSEMWGACTTAKKTIVTKNPVARITLDRKNSKQRKELTLSDKDNKECPIKKLLNSSIAMETSATAAGMAFHSGDTSTGATAGLKHNHTELKFEPSKKDIKKIILKVMNVKKLSPQADIPNENKFDQFRVNPYSKRYFKVKELARLYCPHCKLTENSGLQCYIDLKTQTICHRVTVACRHCRSWMNLQFSPEAIEKMAMISVNKFFMNSKKPSC